MRILVYIRKYHPIQRNTAIVFNNEFRISKLIKIPGICKTNPMLFTYYKKLLNLLANQF